MGTFSPPFGVTGPTWTTQQVQSQIAVVAANKGVPVPLAEAQAQVESGFNPYARGDYHAGQPTSFGIYQLHQGGELDSLPGPLSAQIAAAYDPATNAKVSLSRLASAYQANPGADPGAIAAAAQRPADPTGYARKVDAALAGNVGSAGGGITLPPLSAGGSVDTGSSGGAFGSGLTHYGLGPFSITIWSWPRIAFVLFGTMLVLIGVWVTFGGSGSSTTKVQVDESPAGSAASSSTSSPTVSTKTRGVKRSAAAEKSAAADAAAGA